MTQRLGRGCSGKRLRRVRAGEPAPQPAVAVPGEDPKIAIAPAARFAAQRRLS